MKQRYSIKIPTHTDYWAYDGEHCQRIWQSLSEGWRCPGCNRTKFQLLRWTRKIWPEGDIPYGTPHMGWKAGLHEHHDHGNPPRFQNAVICDLCNGVDATVKNHFKGLIHPDFSFSPEEMRRFVKAQPHGRHTIDFQVALSIYQQTPKDQTTLWMFHQTPAER